VTPRKRSLSEAALEVCIFLIGCAAVSMIFAVAWKLAGPFATFVGVISIAALILLRWRR
jgi:hypothetical protein